VPAIALACIGACRGPRALRVLGGGWVLALLPFLLLDITGIRYVPMRTAGYLAPGLALLGGAGAAWLVGQASTRPWAQARARRTALVAVAMVGLLVLAGTGASAKGWYRIYPESDQRAFQAAASGSQQSAAHVIVGTWQASAQVGAWGGDVRAEPKFFEDPGYRRWVEHKLLHDQPFLIAVDKEARLRADPSSPEYQNFSLDFLKDKPLVAKGKHAAVYIDQPPLDPGLWRPGGVMALR